MLTLNFATGAFGTSQLTLRATDTDGGFVEMSTAGADFRLYSEFVSGEAGVDFPAGINFQPSQLLTAGSFGQVNGDASYIDEAAYRAFLDWLPGPTDQLVVLNLEDPAFAGNTPQARENLGWAMDVLADARPDLTRAGVYRVLPERSYWAPAGVAAAENLLDLGVNVSWATNYLEDRQVVYDEWVERNSRYRTAPLADGSTVADKVSVINASLYTFYGNSFSRYAPNHIYAQVIGDAAANTWTLADNYVANGMKVRIVAEDTGELPSQLENGLDYYVVNSTLETFQLSLSAGGKPIDFGSSSGRQYIQVASEYSGHDPSHQSWVDAYAGPNIAEARKFGKETIAYLSPRFEGNSSEYLDKDFFRHQLDAMYELADGISIFDSGVDSADPANHGWWEALTEFQEYIQSPTQFSVTIAGPDHAKFFPLHEDGSIEYVPAANFFGIDTFSYIVHGAKGSTDPIPVVISVTPINDTPVVLRQAPGLVSTGQSSPTASLDTVFADVDRPTSEIYFEIMQNSSSNVLPDLMIDGDQLIFDPDTANLGN